MHSKGVGIVVREEASATIKVYLTPEMEEMLDERLAHIEAQIGKLRRMLAASHQPLCLLSLAVTITDALDEVIRDMLQMHIETCVAYAVAKGEEMVLHSSPRDTASCECDALTRRYHVAPGHLGGEGHDLIRLCRCRAQHPPGAAGRPPGRRELPTGEGLGSLRPDEGDGRGPGLGCLALLSEPSGGR